MKDNLERFIANNREGFDVYEPTDAVWNKIKASQARKKVIRLNTRLIWRAAAVILIFLTGFVFQEIRYNVIQHPENIGIAKNNDLEIREIKETEAFFAHKVSSMMSEIETYTANDPGIMEDIKYDMSELDSIYTDLKKDLKDNVSNDEVIEAMIQNYRMKIMILEDLLTELKEINDENKTQERDRYEL